MIELVVATKNKKKLQEIKDILKEVPLQIHFLSDYPDAPRIIENGKTFKDNAVKKAERIGRFTGKLTLGEDSGLCVEALGGKPGVYSARFAGKEKSDAKNNQKVLRLLKGLPLKQRKAHYVCAVALANALGPLGVVEGKCSGVIAYCTKGTRGFGYDPLFFIPKYKKTFGELGEGVKHTMSHRYHALRKARAIIEKYVEKHSAG